MQEALGSNAAQEIAEADMIAAVKEAGEYSTQAVCRLWLMGVF